MFMASAVPTAVKLCEAAGIDQQRRMKELSEDELNLIRRAIEDAKIRSRATCAAKSRSTSSA